MNQRFLTILALGFTLLVILQTGIGGWLFVYNIGITPEQITEYYQDKTLHALLEVIIPHTIFITVALVGILHFLTFIELISDDLKRYLSHSIFVLFLIDQTSGIFISLGITWFGYVKLISWGLFELSLALTFIVLYSKAINSTNKTSP